MTRPRTPARNLVLRAAREEDFAELYAFVFENPDPSIRRRTDEEVHQMLFRGLFFIVTLEDGGRIVAASYVDDPKAEGDVWELGGGYVDPEYRRMGLFRLLGTVAMVNVFILYQPKEPLIAHVLTTNRNPRAVLDWLGFVPMQQAVAYHINQYPGLDHMAPDQNGYVYADIYRHDPTHLCRLVRELAEFPGYLGADGRRATVQIRVPALSPDVLREVLADCE